MESVVFSYSFFTPKSLNKEIRSWDLYNGENRYWYNIPALVVTNSVVYPNSKMKIHLSPDIKSNPLFDVLDKISNSYNVELVFLNNEYVNTEPTMWRYKPVFDKEYDIVFCRDIDSVPNEDEIRSTYNFMENNEFYITTMRTHTNHVIPHTIILAGLCGFRPSKIDFINNISFDMYYNHFKSSSWGLDQSSLINMMCKDQNWTRTRFFDCPISTNYHKVGPALIQCVSLNQDYLKENIDISNINKDLLDIINSETKWAGEPTNLRGEKLIKLLNLDLEESKTMKDIIDSCDDNIKNFYYNV